MVILTLLDDVSSAVLDFGSYETRAGKFFFIIAIGYSGEDQPRSVIPSCVGALGPEHQKSKVVGGDTEMVNT